jgi:hypothetical protein
MLHNLRFSHGFPRTSYAFRQSIFVPTNDSVPVRNEMIKVWEARVIESTTEFVIVLTARSATAPNPPAAGRLAMITVSGFRSLARHSENLGFRFKPVIQCKSISPTPLYVDRIGFAHDLCR